MRQISVPSGQNGQKISLKECVYINSALKIQCIIVKNTLLQTAFLPTGLVRIIEAKTYV